MMKVISPDLKFVFTTPFKVACHGHMNISIASSTNSVS